ncbi:PIG-L deacetylase family protein [Streptomyces sp. NPDC004667]|uniref:PIG-L deacetylase family protein n=1 Tax=Streptomyces sp. NPDC004667 TaxID=3154285 RepID=UPI0033A6CA6A
MSHTVRHPTRDTVLAVAAHPDDVDFYAGGTIAKWAAGGSDVVLCVITDGDAGSAAPGEPRHELPARRRSEQIAAARTLGVRDVRFLNDLYLDDLGATGDGTTSEAGRPYRDGRLTVSTALRRDLTRVIRQVRPGRVVLHSPSRGWDALAPYHPDHLAAGEAALCAVYPDAENPYEHPELLVEEGLPPWQVDEVWLMGHPDPDRTVDVTEFTPVKIAALRQHASQSDSFGDELVHAQLVAQAEAGGLAPTRLAERFRVIRRRLPPI